MIRVPTIDYRSVPEEGNGLGYFVGTCLDELVDFALDSGCTESELEERLSEAFDRHEEAAS